MSPGRVRPMGWRRLLLLPIALLASLAVVMLARTLAQTPDLDARWRLDGADLTAEHGGPLRLVPPPTKWGYKGVKWVSRLTLIEEFTPGFWETLVGDPHGDIPQDVLDHLEESIRDERYGHE